LGHAILVWNHTCEFKSNSRCVLVWFWNHEYDFRPNCTPLSLITIINYNWRKQWKSQLINERTSRFRWSPSSWFWAKRRNWRKSSNLRTQSLKSTKPPASVYGASERRWQTTANNRQLVGLFSAPLSRETFESMPWSPSMRVLWSCNTGCLRQWMVHPLYPTLHPRKSVGRRWLSHN